MPPGTSSDLVGDGDRALLPVPPSPPRGFAEGGARMRHRRAGGSTTRGGRCLPGPPLALAGAGPRGSKEPPQAATASPVSPARRLPQPARKPRRGQTLAGAERPERGLSVPGGGPGSGTGTGTEARLAPPPAPCAHRLPFIPSFLFLPARFSPRPGQDSRVLAPGEVAGGQPGTLRGGQGGREERTDRGTGERTGA